MGRYVAPVGKVERPQQAPVDEVEAPAHPPHLVKARALRHADLLEDGRERHADIRRQRGEHPGYAIRPYRPFITAYTPYSSKPAAVRPSSHRP